MKKYKTGEKYKEFICKNNVSVMKFDGKNVNVFILEKNPDKKTIENISNSKPFFQIFTKNNIIFLFIKFNTPDWIDIPYIHNKNNIQNIQKIEDDIFGYPCNIFFIDADNGEVLLKKYDCLSNGLSKALYFAIEKQDEHLPKNILEKINSIRASFHPNEIARLSLGR